MSEQHENPQDLEQQIIARALKDAQFREQLVASPREVIESTLGTRLPEGVQVKVIEQEPNTLYLVLPLVTPGAEGTGELSEGELGQVAGGGYLTFYLCMGGSMMCQGVLRTMACTVGCQP